MPPIVGKLEFVDNINRKHGKGDAQPDEISKYRVCPNTHWGPFKYGREKKSNMQ